MMSWYEQQLAKRIMFTVKLMAVVIMFNLGMYMGYLL